MDNKIKDDKVIFYQYRTVKTSVSSISHMRLTTIAKLGEDIKGLLYPYSTRIRESVYALFFDSDNTFMGYISLGEGDIKGAIIDYRGFINAIASIGAVSVIIVHNHPSNTTKMTQSDLAAYDCFFEICKTLKVKLKDFVILTEKHIYSHKLLKWYDY